MKSWTDLEPDRYRLLTTHFTPGRGGQQIKYVVIHHNAGILSIDDIWQVWQSREASAHYQVTTSGEIGQLVNDSDTAWHAANLLRNQQSIGIEHSNSGGASADWPIAEETLEEGAHLVAAICRYYNLGRPAWGGNVRPHSETGQTSCPYHLSPTGKYGASYIARAQYWYDQMTNGNVAPSPTPNKEITVSEADRIIEAVNRHTADFITGFVGPIGSDVKDIREQATGGRNAGEYPGWAQLGGKTVVDALGLILDQLVGYEKDNEGYTFTGWPQSGNKTLVDAVAELQQAMKKVQDALLSVQIVKA